MSPLFSSGKTGGSRPPLAKKVGRASHSQTIHQCRESSQEGPEHDPRHGLPRRDSPARPHRTERRGVARPLPPGSRRVRLRGVAAPTRADGSGRVPADTRRARRRRCVSGDVSGAGPQGPLHRPRSAAGELAVRRRLQDCTPGPPTAAQALAARTAGRGLARADRDRSAASRLAAAPRRGDPGAAGAVSRAVDPVRSRRAEPRRGRAASGGRGGNAVQPAGPGAAHAAAAARRQNVAVRAASRHWRPSPSPDRWPGPRLKRRRRFCPVALCRSEWSRPAFSIS